jgi:hypothetical protein
VGGDRGSLLGRGLRDCRASFLIVLIVLLALGRHVGWMAAQVEGVDMTLYDSGWCV